MGGEKIPKGTFGPPALTITETVLLECIRSRKLLSVLCIATGSLAIMLGFMVIIVGRNPENSQVLQIMNMSVTSTGAGATVMATSVLWGFFAYKIRPQPFIDDYVKRRQVLEGEEPRGISNNSVSRE